MKRDNLHLPFLSTDVLTVLVSTAAVFFVLAFGGKALEAYRLQRHNATLRSEVGNLEKRNAELTARRDFVQTPAFVEKVAREQFKWAKAGEKFVVTIFHVRPAAAPSPTPGVQTGDDSGTHAAAATSHWSEWWHLLASAFD